VKGRESAARRESARGAEAAKGAATIREEGVMGTETVRVGGRRMRVVGLLVTRGVHPRIDVHPT